MLEKNTMLNDSLDDRATIHIVDDDESVRRSMARLLKSRGWQVQLHESASHFLESAPAEQPGCLLLDLRMPGMTGLELQERLAELGVTIPIVFLSGNGDIPHSVSAIKHGAIDFLVKPVTEDALFNALEEAIARQRKDTAARDSISGIRACYGRLSRREREVLRHVAKGRLNKQIAFDLGIAEKTVKVHRARVMEKMQVGSLAALVESCLLAGIKHTPES